MAGMTGWQIFQSGGDRDTDHESDARKAPLCCRFPWQEEGVSGAMLLEAAFSWEADLIKGSNVDI